MKKYHVFLFLFALVMGFTSCSSNDDGGSEGTAKIAVKLTDAPGDYQHVYVEVEDVMIKTTTDGSEEEGWTSLEGVKTGVIDLLSLTGGVTELLVDTEIEAGYLHQIRLVLGDNNTVVVKNGEQEQEFALKVPSGQQSGLKVMVGEELVANAEYIFILDFDVDKSVKTTNEGGFKLDPVIRMAMEEKSGSIVGSVHPTTEQALITVQNATVNASAYTDEDGNFQVHGLPAGMYKVTATPVEGLGLNVSFINNVEVEQGVITTLDPLFLDGE